MREVGVGMTRRWVPVDPLALARWWLRTYPGPGGVTTFWYGLDSPSDQTLAVLEALRSSYRVLVSGDAAVDQLAPWRRPARSRLYLGSSPVDTRDGARGETPGESDGNHSGVLNSGIDLGSLGLVASGAEEATLELVLPADPGLWSSAGSQDADPADTLADLRLPLADLLQVAWDLQHAPGPDQDQALERFLPLLFEQVESVGSPLRGDDPTRPCSPSVPGAAGASAGS